MQKKIPFLMLLALAGFIIVMLAGCSDGGGGVRATAEALGTRFPSGKVEATSPPAVQVVEATRIVEMPVEVTRIVEATVIVEQSVQVPVQVEATRIVEVVVTATPAPDIQGFSESGIDESVQPCPAPFWKNGQCVATQQQIEDYAAQGGN